MNKFITNTIILTAAESGQVVFRDINTIGYNFINTGNCPVMINNYLLQPSSSFKTFEPNMIDFTSYRINFQQFSACATLNAELTIILYNKAL